ncbi:MAG: DUF1028 domain-containing protein [bacterium]|nr:DUF1028 domain-containing protein [bacterium]
MTSRTIIRLVIAGAVLLGCTAAASPDGTTDSERYAATFSIVAYDPETEEWGIAVASRVLAAGYDVSWAKAGVGAIATQAMVNIGYGTDGLILLEEGLSAEETLTKLLAEDEGREKRQVAIIDAAGNVIAFTGDSTLDWSGHKTGEYYSVQGNILVGEEVLTEMAKAYEESEGPLARRLVNALIAGDEAGGDSRGKQSSGILVVRDKGGYQGKFDRLVDIRVDDHDEPVWELARIYDLWEPTYVVARYFDSGGEKEMEYALGTMERMLAEKPDDPEAHNALAWEMASRKLYPERALEIAIRANELAPDDPNIMDTLAEAYWAAGDYTSAVDWEKKALEMDPDNDFFNEQLKKFEEAGE